ncbi:hypothetical protein ScPMuIL_013779 [Solemya velum]
MAAITVTPDKALVDEAVTITVTGLDRHQAMTLCARVTETTTTFASCASYVADDTGTVDVAKNSSIQGTYTVMFNISNIHRSTLKTFLMMITCLKDYQLRVGLRCLGRNSTTEDPLTEMGVEGWDCDRNVFVPREVKISVFSGHITLNQIFGNPHPVAIAETSCYRWFKSKSVTKLPVNVGRLGGSLFLPPGDQAVPGIVDLSGLMSTRVETMESKGALLASRGFATFVVSSGDFMPHCITDLSYLQVWKGDAKILMIVSEDDQAIDPDSSRRLLNSVPACKRTNFEIAKYSWAGHIVEHPYTPYYASIWHPIWRVMGCSGGKAKPHADAQQDSWLRIQEFFHKHLHPGTEDCVVLSSRL